MAIRPWPKARPAPNSSDDYIVSQTVYIDTSTAGPIIETIDNAGIITQTQSDLMGRTIRTIQDYVPSGLDLKGLPTATDTAEDVTTAFQYDSGGRQVTQTAYDATGMPVVPEATDCLYTSPIDGSLQTIEVDPGSTDVLSQDAETGDWTISTDTGDHTTTTDGWGNETCEWQALTGSVDTGSTPAVQYVYDDGAVGSVAQYVRLCDVIYPASPGSSSGRDVHYGYGDPGSVDYIMSQLATIGESDGTVDAAFTYLGGVRSPVKVTPSRRST